MKDPGHQSRQSEQKIVIIGCGPAGSAAAIWCAKQGFSVTMIETAKFPRDRPGEALHPGIECLFTQLSVNHEIQSANFLRYPGIWVKWDCKPTLIPFGSNQNMPWLGYQVRRAELDLILVERARMLGVVISQPCQALAPILEENRVVGVKTSCGELMADFTIDAGGSGHWLAQKLKLSIQRYSPPLYVNYGYAEGCCPSRDLAPAIMAIRGGWLWTAKVHNNIYQWMRLMFERTPICQNWLPTEFEGLKVKQASRGADVSWRCVVTPAGSGYFIVGDAFGVVDPASFHGILRGMMSGIMASHAIFQISKTHLNKQLASLLYNEWLSNWYLHDVTKLRSLYTRHPDHPRWSYT